MLLWKAARGALPVAASLNCRTVIPSSECVRCGLEETTEHVLFHCDFAKKVLKLAPVHKALRMNQIASTRQGIIDGNKLMCLSPIGISCPIFPWICAAIWTSRNQNFFESRTFSESETMTKALKDAREWQKAQQNLEKSRQAKNHRRRQKTRDPIFVYSYTNASWQKETRVAGLGWIFLASNNEKLGRGSKGLQNIRSPQWLKQLQF